MDRRKAGDRLMHLLSIDTGWSTGIALLSVPDDAPAMLAGAWQFEGGVSALMDWHNGLPPVADETIVEKFTARATDGFSYTTRSLEPLVCEGFLIAHGYVPPYQSAKTPGWVQPPAQYFAGGKGKADKKKRQHAFLKATGEFYVTGKQFGTPNADDARSAIAHGLAYLRETHAPTRAHYWRDE